MDGQTRVLKSAIIAAIGYIAIMAVGMFTSGHIFGVQYGDPNMVYILVYFELALSLYILIMARRIFGRWHCGWSPIDWTGIWWLVPNFLVIGALFYIALGAENVALTGLVMVVILTMCLVGFSEELAFRGIVLKGGLRDLSQGRAIILSAMLFSLLHSVNILAFLPFDAMLSQLGLTFIYGLAFACYAIRLNSLIALMICHALWDMVQFLGAIFEADFGQVINIGIVVNVVIAAALYLLVLRKGPAQPGAIQVS